jgi:hypothetical protein
MSLFLGFELYTSLDSKEWNFYAKGVNATLEVLFTFNSISTFETLMLKKINVKDLVAE